MTTKFSFFKKGKEATPIHEITVDPGDGAVVTSQNLGIKQEDALFVIGQPYLVVLNEAVNNPPPDLYRERTLCCLKDGALNTLVLETRAAVTLGGPHLVTTKLSPARGEFSISGAKEDFDFSVKADPEIPDTKLAELANRVRGH